MAQAIGIDIGGTFVDVIVADGAELRIAKAPSTPSEPAVGVLRVLDRFIADGTVRPAEVRGIVHGCTVATNALLERKWARTALVTTRGFRDVLEIGRQNRPSLYDLAQARPPAIVSRDLRLEVAERVGAAGEEVLPLDASDLERVVERLRGEDVAAVAVSFLFSYLRPEHEKATGEFLRQQLGVPVVLSSDVLPEMREFERTSTTVLSAALRPVIGAYLAQLEEGGAARGLPRVWRIMQSSGAVTDAERAQERPASLLLSGPAGGVQGARAVGAAIGERDLITMDMGGTSCDVALVTGGVIERTQAGCVGGYPVALPMVSVHTIGAGGGSVAWIDRGGALRVGPESMGASPGPACYGRGGRATVTDAHLVLGHLVPDLPLGGIPDLDLAEARRAVERDVARPLGLSIETAARGVLEVADAAMERAIRVVTVERGRDPRDYCLVAFGGAGPLHGASIARRLGIRRVLVPRAAGVLSAYGLLVAEVGHDHSRGLVSRLDRLRDERLDETVRELANRGREALAAEGVVPAEMRFLVSADLRYAGQAHELTVPITWEGERSQPDELPARFEAAHAARFGHVSAGEPIELVAVRVRAEGPALADPSRMSVRPAPAREAGRRHSSGARREESQVGRVAPREAFASGAEFRGPLSIVGDDATVLVPAYARGSCDRFGNILLEVAP